MTKIVNPVPGYDAQERANAEASVENAHAEIKKRMEALKNGEITPDELKEQHKAEIVEENKKSKYPTLIVDLPSKGLLYDESDPLSAGYVEMKYMTAKEEDILTTESYIKKGVVLDKLFQSLIISKINYDNMLLGDRDAIMLAARIYGYGETYNTKITTPSGNTMTVPIDLNEVPHKEIDENLFSSRENKFYFKTMSGVEIVFKLLTNGDQKEIQKNLKKVKRGDSRDTQLTSRLFQMIQSIDGNSDRKFIKAYIENDLRAIDSRRFREYVQEIQPGVDMSIDVIDEETGEPFRTDIAIGLDFFWTNV
jgi:hypothetical protein